MDSITYRASKRKPCPVCGEGTKNCSATSDGLHFCRGKARDGWRKIGEDDTGFGHYRRDDEPPAQPVKSKPKPKPPTDWQALAAEFVCTLAGFPQCRIRLGEVLGLPCGVFEVFALGLSGPPTDGANFTIPERNAEGVIIGIATRRERRGVKADKKCIAGSNRGVTIPGGWRDVLGPVLLVEGFSDAAALTAAGLCAIGRPSNLGGAELLAELLADWPADRGIIVVGDNDENGAGLDGAIRTSSKLCEALGRRVPYALPPTDAKDAREWLTAEARRETAWMDRGAELLAFLEANLRDPESTESRADCIPEILIEKREWHVNAQACAALGRETDIYQRGGLLVHVVEQAEEPETDAVVRRLVGAVSVRELAKPLLRERLTHCAKWMALVGRGEDVQKVAAHPPDWSISAVHVRAEWPAIRRLEAVVDHPVLLGNGTILGANGYDRSSSLLLRMPLGLTIAVPERPTKDDVRAAVADLGEVVKDFPFESPAHRAAWFASLLTPLAWFAFNGSAPMFLFDSNIRAAGKGLLADCAAIIITGRRFPVMNYTSDKEELRKKITTLAVEGERLVLLDNLAGAVGNDVLDAALTTPAWKDRILGGNRIYNGPLNVTWYATGNNVLLGADTSRRVCHIRLESAEERPETRTDVTHEDLRDHVRRNRPKLLTAALTMLRGWVVAGKPRHGLKPWGSYEPWSSVIREAIVFAGLPDPGETRVQLQTMADRDANAMAEIIAGILELAPDGRGMTTAEIVKVLKDDATPSAVVADMRAAVEELCGKLCGRALGFKFRHFARRNFGGKMIDKASSAHGRNRWAVVSVTPPRGREDANHSNHPITSAPPDGCDGGDGWHDPDRTGNNNADSFAGPDLDALFQ